MPDITTDTPVDLSAETTDQTINVKIDNYSQNVLGSTTAKDTITIDSDSFTGTVNAGDGNNTINVRGNDFSGTINSGSGSDILNISSVDFSGDVSTGDGNDSVSLSGSIYASSSTFNTQEGNDTIIVNAGSVQSIINAGLGNDFISVNGPSNYGTYLGDDGEDTIEVRSSYFNGEIDGGANDDVIRFLQSAQNALGDIRGGDGDDDIYILANNFRGSIDGGDGNDSIYVEGSVSGAVTVNNVETIDFNKDSIRNKVDTQNQIALDALQEATTILENAEDNVTALEQSVAELEIQLENINAFGGAGFLSRNIQQQYDQAVIDLDIAKEELSEAQTNFDNANNKVSVTGVTAALEMAVGTVIGSAANDRFTFIGSEKPNFINSKEGDDTITLVGGTENIVNVDGGDGIDSIRLVSGDYEGSVILDNIEKVVIVDSNGFDSSLNANNSDGIGVIMGSRDDNFNITANQADINLGSGDDSLVVSGDFSGTVKGSFGDDFILVGDNFSGTLSGGEGNDRIIVGEGFEGVVDGGEGDNTLLLSNNFNGNYKNFDNLGVTTDGEITLDNNSSTQSLEGSGGVESITLENDFNGTVKNLETLNLASDSSNTLNEILDEEGNNEFILSTINGGEGTEVVEFEFSLGSIDEGDPIDLDDDIIDTVTLTDIEEIKLAENSDNFISNDNSLRRIIGNDGTENITFDSSFEGTISDIESITIAPGSTNNITDLSGNLDRIVGSVDGVETITLNKNFDGTLVNIDFVIVKGGGENKFIADAYLQQVTGTGTETVFIADNFNGTLSGVFKESYGPDIDYSVIDNDDDDGSTNETPDTDGIGGLFEITDLLNGTDEIKTIYDSGELPNNNRFLVTSGSENIIITTGTGNDRITTEDGVTVDIITEDGSDEITFGNNSGSTLVSSDSVDTVIVGENSSGSIETRGGNDTIDIGSGNSGDINSGEGDDIVTIGDEAFNSNPNVDLQINLGSGSDTLTLGNNSDAIILTTDPDPAGLDPTDTYQGNDTITIGDNFGGIVDGGQITTSFYDDTIVLGDEAFIEEINTGGGDDQVTIGDEALITLVNTGDGNDTLNIGSQTGQENNGDITILTGNGDDIINIASTVSLGIDAGDGVDTINVNANFGGQIETGLGDDTVFLDVNFNGSVTNAGGDDTLISLGILNDNQYDSDDFVNIIMESVIFVGDDEILTVPNDITLISEIVGGNGIEELTLEETTLNYLVDTSNDVNVTDLEVLTLADETTNAFHSTSLETLNTGNNSVTSAIVQSASDVNIGINSSLEISDTNDTILSIDGSIGNETLTLSGNSEADINMGIGDDIVTVDNDADNNSVGFTGEVLGGSGLDTLIILGTGTNLAFNYSAFERIGLADTGDGFVFTDLDEVTEIFGVGEEDQQESVIFDSNFNGILSGIENISFAGDERTFTVDSDTALLSVSGISGDEGLDDDLTLVQNFGSQDPDNLEITYGEIVSIEFLNLLGEENFLRHDEDLDWIQGNGESDLTLEYEYVGVIENIETLNLQSSGSILTLWGNALQEINGTDADNESVTVFDTPTLDGGGQFFALSNIERFNVVEGGFGVTNDRFLRHITGDAPLTYEFGRNDLYDHESFVPYVSEANGVTLLNEYIGIAENMGSLHLAEGTTLNIIDNSNVTQFTGQGGGEGASGFTGITLLNNHEAYREGTIFSRLDDLELIAFNEVVTVDDKEHINQNAYINDLELALAGLTPDVVDRSLFNDIVAYEEALEQAYYDEIELANAGLGAIAAADAAKAALKDIDVNDFESRQDYWNAIEAARIGPALDPNLFVDFDAYQTELEAQINLIDNTALPDYKDNVVTGNYENDLETTLFIRNFFNDYATNHALDANFALAEQAYIEALETEAARQGFNVEVKDFNGDADLERVAEASVADYIAALEGLGFVGALVNRNDFDYFLPANQDDYINYLENEVIEAGKRYSFQHDDSAEQINGDKHNDFLKINYAGDMTTNLVDLKAGQDTFIIQADSISQFLTIQNVENIFLDVENLIFFDSFYHDNLENIFISGVSGTRIDIFTGDVFAAPIVNQHTGLANLYGDGIDDFFMDGLGQIFILQDKGIGETINNDGEYLFRGEGWYVVDFSDQYNSVATFATPTEASYVSRNDGVHDDRVVKIYGTAAGNEQMTFAEGENFQGSIWDLESLILGKATTNILSFRSDTTTEITTGGIVETTFHFSDENAVINATFSGSTDTTTVAAGHSGILNLDTSGGDDTTHFNHGNITGEINLITGSGDDTITMGESFSKTTTFNGVIELGAGDDFYDGTFSSNVDADINGGTGDDTIIVGENHTGNINGGGQDGDQILVFSGFTGNITGFDTVSLNEDAEITINPTGVSAFNGTVKGIESLTFDGGIFEGTISQIETLNIQNGSSVSIDPGELLNINGDINDDTLTLTGTISEDMTIDLAGGINILQLDEATIEEDATLENIEEIVMLSGSSINITANLDITGSDDSDSVIATDVGDISLGDGDNTIVLDSANSIAVGDGNDNITINGDDYNAGLNTRAGNDNITFNGDNISGTYDGGANDDEEVNTITFNGTLNAVDGATLVDFSEVNFNAAGTFVINASKISKIIGSDLVQNLSYQSNAISSFFDIDGVQLQANSNNEISVDDVLTNISVTNPGFNESLKISGQTADNLSIDLGDGANDKVNLDVEVFRGSLNDIENITLDSAVEFTGNITATAPTTVNFFGADGASFDTTGWAIGGDEYTWTRGGVTLQIADITGVEEELNGNTITFTAQV